MPTSPSISRSTCIRASAISPIQPRISAPSRGCAPRLRPGGALVLETTGKETAARDFTAGESFERGGWDVRTEFAVVGAWEGLRNRWILSRGGEIVDRSFVLRLYSGTELKTALLEAGFADVARSWAASTARPTIRPRRASWPWPSPKMLDCRSEFNCLQSPANVIAIIRSQAIH